FLLGRGSFTLAVSQTDSSVSLLGSSSLRKTIASSGGPRNPIRGTLQIDRRGSADSDRLARSLDAKSPSERRLEAILPLSRGGSGSVTGSLARAFGPMGFPERSTGRGPWRF